MHNYLYLLPILCPIAMGAMMWMMMRGDKKPAAPADQTLQNEITELRHEISLLRMEQDLRSHPADSSQP